MLELDLLNPIVLLLLPEEVTEPSEAESREEGLGVHYQENIGKFGRCFPCSSATQMLINGVVPLEWAAELHHSRSLTPLPQRGMGRKYVKGAQRLR